MSAIGCQLSALNERRKRSFQFCSLAFKLLKIRAVKKFQVSRKEQPGFQFACRTHCDLEETAKLQVCFSATALGDIRPDRNRGSPQYLHKILRRRRQRSRSTKLRISDARRFHQCGWLRRASRPKIFSSCDASSPSSPDRDAVLKRCFCEVTDSAVRA